MGSRDGTRTRYDMYDTGVALARPPAASADVERHATMPTAAPTTTPTTTPTTARATAPATAYKPAPYGKSAFGHRAPGSPAAGMHPPTTPDTAPPAAPAVPTVPTVHIQTASTAAGPQDRGQGGTCNPIASMMGRFNTREVRCCSCGSTFRVAASARSAACASCHQQVATEDLRIKMLHWGGPIRCCGSVTIAKKARCLAKYILATGPVQVFGQVESVILSGELVEIHPGGVLKGGVIAPRVVMHPGAIVHGGPFKIPCDPIGQADLYVP